MSSVVFRSLYFAVGQLFNLYFVILLGCVCVHVLIFVGFSTFACVNVCECMCVLVLLCVNNGTVIYIDKIIRIHSQCRRLKSMTHLIR